jgi:hypothetical protein
VRRGIAIFVAALALGGCASEVTPLTGCNAAYGIEPDCRFRNPEDIASIPGTDWLVVSQFGAMDGTRAGSLAAYQPSTGRLEELFPVGEYEDDRRWGETACGPVSVTAFSPHGIDVDVHPSGRTWLLAVNHGVRESVELFEVEASNAGLALFWRGCALAPEGDSLNDVRARADGGFWTTRMMGRGAQLGAIGAVLFGSDTGWVYAWTPGAGFARVTGSEGSLPNGIEKSQDERHLYVSATGTGEVRRLELASGRVVARADAARADNLTWSGDGRLLVATSDDSLSEMLACATLDAGACGAAFEVLSLDPLSLDGTAWLAHRGAPMGGVSVATHAGDSLYLGSYAGDRVARWRIPTIETQ